MPGHMPLSTYPSHTRAFINSVNAAQEDRVCDPSAGSPVSPTTAGPVLVQGHRPARNAPIVDGLCAAGAVVAGKANLHEFSFGLSTESSLRGATRNPFDLARNPGGPSGGTAVAVAVGNAVAGVGTDTGGSVRFPAAHTSLRGLRPTAGVLPATGIVPISRLMDTPGPIPRTAADLGVLFDVMRGVANPAPLARRDTHGMRLGVVWDRFGDDGDERLTADTVRAALTTLERHGVRLVDVDGGGFDVHSADTAAFEFAATFDEYLRTTTPRPALRDARAAASDPRVEPRAHTQMQRALQHANDEGGLARAVTQRVVVRRGVEQALDENQLDAPVYPDVPQAGTAARRG